MRLWHKDLIKRLPRAQLLGQHRECCALRGLGWGKKHATVDYVFTHPRSWLVRYHRRVMDEMTRRGYNVAVEWLAASYCGKRAPRQSVNMENAQDYPEHDAAYMAECLNNLSSKNTHLLDDK